MALWLIGDGWHMVGIAVWLGEWLIYVWHGVLLFGFICGLVGGMVVIAGEWHDGSGLLLGGRQRGCVAWRAATWLGE